MTPDITRVEIEALYPYFSPQAVDVIRRLLDQLNARADAAAGQMRDRCAAVVESDFAYTMRDGHPGNRCIHGALVENDMPCELCAAIAIRALPLHEEPKP